MLQAIRTKFHGPTSTRGARVTAKCTAGSVSVSWDYALNTEANHKAACEAVLRKLGWTTGAGYGEYIGGWFGDEAFWVSDDGRARALKGFVNSMRAATWSGNPWGKQEFRACVDAVGRSYGFHGETTSAPTTDDEARARGLI